MDFHAAMETFAEAWVAANVQTAVNSDPAGSEPNQRTQMPSKSTEDMSKEKSATTQQTPEKDSPRKEPKSPLSSEGAKSLPIHCVVEQVSGIPSFDNNNTGCKNIHLELDSYAILPTSTTLCELVRVALTKLGYSSSDTLNAKGAIQLKNWKPLSFEKISDNLQATVEDIMGDLTNVATLKIRICSQSDIPERWTDDNVRCAVIELLQEMSQSTMAQLSPLSQSTISNISNGKYHNRICPDKCQEFGNWYRNYKLDPSVAIGSDNVVAKDTRLTFHSKYELPLMRQWYNMNATPSETKFYFYAEELNRGHVRKSRPKVTVKRLQNWWKNEKQKEKRIINASSKPSQSSTCRQRSISNLINLDSGSKISVIHENSPGQYFAISSLSSVQYS